ncbi:MAG: low-specificity L-threonine aldolase [Deltaproteobacteria bacterium]|nr:low-specificity L-threonine aldolase [Deltaproteobacteria bacterium]
MSQSVVDLRSDTVTRPSAAMRKVMAEAEVGDDVFGEDPNVNALQEEAAALLGKESALYLPSGTMANQVALKTHTQAGDEVIAHPLAHIVRAESAGAAALSGIQFRMVGEPDGSLNPEAVTAAIQDGSNVHYAPTRLLCLENTHNFAGGTVLSLAGMEAVAAAAHAKGVAVHLDGARVLNAAAVLDIRPDRITRLVDTTTLCFSKGLGAPVGSVIAGPRAFIERSKRFRKMYGGGMRQAGILAAAARYALKHNVARLAEDHAHARLLAEGLRESPYITLTFGMPQSNLVFFSLKHPRLTMPQLVEGMKQRGILIGGTGPYSARVVTHLDVDRAGVQRAVAAFHEVLKT